MTAARIGLGLAALLLAADAPALPIDQVIAAERAFAEDGLAHGINVSFPRHAAPDAIIFAPGPVNVRERFAGRAPEAQNPGLDWWPVFAGAARSGDLGFTTGPYALQGTVSGYYFTVWRRQPDGSWQWIFDGGGEASVDQAPAKGSPVARLAPSAGHAASAEAAMDEVRAAEAGLARDARLHAARALAARLAPDVRLYVAGQRPVTRAADAAPALASLPAVFTFGPVAGGAASSGGDLAWVWGDAAWTDSRGPGQGRYVRVWQHRRSGWRIVVAELIPGPRSPE